MGSVEDSRLALALEAARLGTWTWDMVGGTTTWDARLEELHGLAAGSFGGTYEDWLAALYPDDRAECRARVERALADPGPYLLLHRTVWPDGSVHSVECRGTVLTDSDGSPIGTTGVAIDVTERERDRGVTTRALARERDAVDVLQQALLPTSIPAIDGVSIARRYVAAERNLAVGGDWYAVVPLPDDCLGIGMGDVAGHGLDAVAHMAAIRFSLRAFALTFPTSPERVLDGVNEVVRVFEEGVMTTAVYGVLNPMGRQWTYANAGHCPVLIRRADGKTELVQGRCDPPLGVATGFRRRDTTIEPGSILVLYTDGLVERRTEVIDDGLERLRRACETGPGDPEALCDHLVDVMLPNGNASDDVALLVVALS